MLEIKNSVTYESNMSKNIRNLPRESPHDRNTHFHNGKTSLK